MMNLTAQPWIGFCRDSESFRRVGFHRSAACVATAQRAEVRLPARWRAGYPSGSYSTRSLLLCSTVVVERGENRWVSPPRSGAFMHGSDKIQGRDAVAISAHADPGFHACPTRAAIFQHILKYVCKAYYLDTYNYCRLLISCRAPSSHSLRASRSAFQGEIIHRKVTG